GPDTNSDGKFDGQDDPGFYAAANPFRWSTKRFDPETGSPQRIAPSADLSDFGLRYYSATLGRWINRDPIGDFATANLVRHSESRRRRTFGGLGGTNVYAYVGNNPTNRTDYLGMMYIPCPPGQPCDDEGSSSSGPPSQEENDKKPCPKKPESQPSAPVRPPLGPRKGSWKGYWQEYMTCFNNAFNDSYAPCADEARYTRDTMRDVYNDAYNVCVTGAASGKAACVGECGKLGGGSATWVCSLGCDALEKTQRSICRMLQGGLLIGNDLRYLKELDDCVDQATDHALDVRGEFTNY
ncbi:MAG: RHS repeat-associated core domain-containing protein, partial [Planctomycetota bacterium]